MKRYRAGQVGRISEQPLVERELDISDLEVTGLNGEGVLLVEDDLLVLVGRSALASRQVAARPQAAGRRPGGGSGSGTRRPRPCVSSRPGSLRRRQRDVGQLHPFENLVVDGLGQGIDSFGGRLPVRGLGVEQLGECGVVPIPQPVPVVDTVVAVCGQDDGAALGSGGRDLTGHGEELVAGNQRVGRSEGVVTICVVETPRPTVER